MILPQPQAKSGPKPQMEFEALDALASQVLNVPKSAVSPAKKKTAPIKLQKDQERG